MPCDDQCICGGMKYYGGHEEGCSWLAWRRQRRKEIEEKEAQRTAQRLFRL